jgi:low temperature requirement protein LtrA
VPIAPALTRILRAHLNQRILVIGATLAGLFGRPGSMSAPHADRPAIIVQSADPGRLGRSAYTFIHLIMVAGIIVVAAADYLVLIRPNAVGAGSTSWLILGGTGLYLGGLLAFKLNVAGGLPRRRAAALVVVALLGLVAPHVTALVLSSCAAVVAAVGDYVQTRSGQRSTLAGRH